MLAEEKAGRKGEKMKIVELLKTKNEERRAAKPVTIAFLGDSVTQGCFECYMKNETVQTVFDYRYGYANRVSEILHILYPAAQVNIINSGVSGDSAIGGAERLERDVLAYNPDLCVVSFGLNDSGRGVEGIEIYQKSLESIFERLRERDIEIIFLTENSMCTGTSPHLKEEKLISLSKGFANTQNNGVLRKYFDAAEESCKKFGVKYVDLYSVWEKMIAAGVDVTELLSNKLNHPIREIHYYMAMKLVEAML